MAEPSQLSRKMLEHARDVGAATSLSAYVRLMARELDVDADNESLTEMVMKMVEPMNIATEAIWRALMHDHVGKEQALIRFRQSLLEL